MCGVFQSPEVDGILLADASNAFNRLNRGCCLQNIRHSCPSLSTAVINTYRSPARLYVGGEIVHSSEGITQGDPLSMAMYGLGVLPLIEGV